MNGSLDPNNDDKEPDLDINIDDVAIGGKPADLATKQKSENTAEPAKKKGVTDSVGRDSSNEDKTQELTGLLKDDDDQGKKSEGQTKAE